MSIGKLGTWSVVGGEQGAICPYCRPLRRGWWGSPLFGVVTTGRKGAHRSVSKREQAQPFAWRRSLTSPEPCLRDPYLRQLRRDASAEQVSADPQKVQAGESGKLWRDGSGELVVLDEYAQQPSEVP